MRVLGYLESATLGPADRPGDLRWAAEANPVRKPFSICGDTEQCLLVETTRVLNHSAGFTVLSGDQACALGIQTAKVGSLRWVVRSSLSSFSIRLATCSARFAILGSLHPSGVS
jgi:hypothetical protein